MNGEFSMTLSARLSAWLFKRHPRLWAWIGQYGQTAVNWYLFVHAAGFLGWVIWRQTMRGQWTIADAAFVAQTAVLAMLLVARSRHRAMEQGLGQQAVAVAAFYSGLPLLAFPGPAAGGWHQGLGDALALTANLIGIVCLFNLGRSFGILIALRRVKTGGLYAWMRHPMYASDLLLRVGICVARPSAWTIGWTIVGILLYWRRAALEERFLARDPEYADYLTRVRWRFLPLRGWGGGKAAEDSGA